MISSLFYFLKILTHHYLTMTLWIIYLTHQWTFFPNKFPILSKFLWKLYFFMFSISPERFSLDTLLWFSPWEETPKLSEINSPKNTISNDSFSNHRLFYLFWFIVMTHHNLFINAKKKYILYIFYQNFTGLIFEFEFLVVIFFLSNWIKFLEIFGFEVTLENQRY